MAIIHLSIINKYSIQLYLLDAYGPIWFRFERFRLARSSDCYLFVSFQKQNRNLLIINVDYRNYFRWDKRAGDVYAAVIHYTHMFRDILLFCIHSLFPNPSKWLNKSVYCAHKCTLVCMTIDWVDLPRSIDLILGATTTTRCRVLTKHTAMMSMTTTTTTTTVAGKAHFTNTHVSGKTVQIIRCDFTGIW